MCPFTENERKFYASKPCNRFLLECHPEYLIYALDMHIIHYNNFNVSCGVFYTSRRRKVYGSTFVSTVREFYKIILTVVTFRKTFPNVQHARMALEISNAQD